MLSGTREAERVKNLLLYHLALLLHFAALSFILSPFLAFKRGGKSILLEVGLW